MGNLSQAQLESTHSSFITKKEIMLSSWPFPSCTARISMRTMQPPMITSTVLDVASANCEKAWMQFLITTGTCRSGTHGTVTRLTAPMLAWFFGKCWKLSSCWQLGCFKYTGCAVPLKLKEGGGDEDEAPCAEFMRRHAGAMRQ